MAKESNIALDYQRRRNEAGVSVIERPQYYIDMTRPAALLAIQRNYDVRREAVHLATTTPGYGHQEIQEFRSRPGRCFYRGSSEITQALSEEAEMQELQALSVLEISTDHWLSESVAAVTNRTREGRSLSTDDTNTDWVFLWLHDGLCVKDDAPNTISAGRSVGGTILDLENQYCTIQEMTNRPLARRHALDGLQGLSGFGNNTPQDEISRCSLAATILNVLDRRFGIENSPKLVLLKINDALRSRIGRSDLCW